MPNIILVEVIEEFASLNNSVGRAIKEGKIESRHENEAPIIIPKGSKVWFPYGAGDKIELNNTIYILLHASSILGYI